jgi:hypothetical protein
LGVVVREWNMLPAYFCLCLIDKARQGKATTKTRQRQDKDKNKTTTTTRHNTIRHETK